MRTGVPLLICPFLAGCLAFGYPAISATPEIALPDTDVHAFRVCSEVTMSGPWMTGPIAFGSSVDDIPVVEATVSPQRDAYFAYYYLLLPIASGSHTRDLEVLLYRPGYETVAIPARPWWQAPGSQRLEKIAWKEAPDLLAQKTARQNLSRKWQTAPQQGSTAFRRRANTPAWPIPR